jgi:ATP-dependent Clp protease ATP-binding subunit ClpA
MIRRKPYSVLLLDEVEKAHPDVWNTFLQILDEGHLTDAKGRKVNFKNTIIIMTSNLGSDVILEAGRKKGIGFDDGSGQKDDNVRDNVLTTLRDHFKPEFLNRLDEVIVFKALSEERIGEIVDIQLGHVAERLAKRHIVLAVTAAAKKALAKKGYDPAFGARPLKRTIQHEILDPLALMMVAGKVKDDTKVKVDAKKDGTITLAA